MRGSGDDGQGEPVCLVLVGGATVEVPPDPISRERWSRRVRTGPAGWRRGALARITAREPGPPPVRLTVGRAAVLRALADD